MERLTLPTVLHFDQGLKTGSEQVALQIDLARLPSFTRRKLEIGEPGRGRAHELQKCLGLPIALIFYSAHFDPGFAAIGDDLRLFLSGVNEFGKARLGVL